MVLLFPRTLAARSSLAKREVRDGFVDFFVRQFSTPSSFPGVAAFGVPTALRPRFYVRLWGSWLLFCDPRRVPHGFFVSWRVPCRHHCNPLIYFDVNGYVRVGIVKATKMRETPCRQAGQGQVFLSVVCQECVCALPQISACMLFFFFGFVQKSRETQTVCLFHSEFLKRYVLALLAWYVCIAVVHNMTVSYTSALEKQKRQVFCPREHGG